MNISRLFVKYAQALVLFGLLFFFACREENRKGREIMSLKFSVADEGRKQSDLFELSNVIQLETNDSVLIDRVVSLIVRSSGFYVMDNKVGRQIIKFDTLGRCLFAISRYGRGPGEFVDMTQLCVDRYDKYLYLYDASQRKVICYDANTGNYVWNFPFNYNAYSFSVLPDGSHFAFYCNYMENSELKKEGRCPNFVIADSLGQVKSSFAYFDSKIEMSNLLSQKDVFFDDDSLLYCFSSYNDTIYSIDKDMQVLGAFMLDYMNDNQVKNMGLLKKVSEYGCIDFKRSEEDHHRAKLYAMSRMNFTERYFYCVGMYLDDLFCFVYDWKLKKAIDLKKLTADVVGRDLYFMASDAECFYFSIPVSILKQSVREDDESYDVKIHDFLKNKDDDVNPVIVKLKIKR